VSAATCAGWNVKYRLPTASRAMPWPLERYPRYYGWTAHIHQIYPSWPPKRFLSSYPADDTWTETNDGNVLGVPHLIPVVSFGPGVT